MRTRIASCPADARNRANGDMGASPESTFALEVRAAARACVVDGDAAETDEAVAEEGQDASMGRPHAIAEPSEDEGAACVCAAAGAAATVDVVEDEAEEEDAEAGGVGNDEPAAKTGRRFTLRDTLATVSPSALTSCGGVRLCTGK